MQRYVAAKKDLHRNTIALRKGFSGARDTYDTYYESNRAGVLGRTQTDSRLNTKEFVVGADLDEVARAYPFSQLNEQPVVNDELNGQPLPVVFDAESATGAAFRRNVAGQVLTFELRTAGRLENVRLTDKETGAVWSAFTGEGLEGPLAGERLRRVKSTSSFWFGCKDFYPDTGVHGLDDTEA